MFGRDKNTAPDRSSLWIITPEAAVVRLHMHLPSCINKSACQWDPGGRRRMVTYVEVSDNGQLLQIWEENKTEGEE